MVVQIISAVFSGVVALAAILIPFLNTLLKNKHEKKLQAEEYYYNCKVKAYTELFTAFAAFKTTKTYGDLKRLSEKVTAAMLHASLNVRNKLLIIFQYTISVDTEFKMDDKVLDTAFSELIPLIADEISNHNNLINNK